MRKIIPALLLICLLLSACQTATGAPFKLENTVTGDYVFSYYFLKSENAFYEIGTDHDLHRELNTLTKLPSAKSCPESQPDVEFNLPSVQNPLTFRIWENRLAVNDRCYQISEEQYQTLIQAAESVEESYSLAFWAHTSADFPPPPLVLPLSMELAMYPDLLTACEATEIRDGGERVTYTVTDADVLGKSNFFWAAATLRYDNLPVDYCVGEYTPTSAPPIDNATLTCKMTLSDGRIYNLYFDETHLYVENSASETAHKYGYTGTDFLEYLQEGTTHDFHRNMPMG